MQEVRNISALHFASSVVNLTASTKWITIQDCESREPVSIRAGARRFTYQLSGQLSLAQRCFSQKGRHSFVMQGAGASGNVFLDNEAINPYSSSEPHSNWVNGALYDNVKAPLTARYWKDISIGWAGANIVFSMHFCRTFPNRKVMLNLWTDMSHPEVFTLRSLKKDLVKELLKI